MCKTIKSNLLKIDLIFVKFIEKKNSHFKKCNSIEYYMCWHVVYIEHENISIENSIWCVDAIDLNLN